MSIAIAPDRTPTGAGAGFYALITDVRTGMLSKNVSCLFVDVLSGTVAKGEPVELLRPDGSASIVATRQLREALGQDVLDLADSHQTKADLGPVTIARTPGLLAPPLPSERGADVEHLLAAVRATRALGFPVEQAQTIKPVPGLTAEQLCTLLRTLPDEAVVLVVQKRMRVALGKHGNPFDIVPDGLRAAMHLAAIGLPDDADRLLLALAAAVQGHRSSVALRAAASAGAMGVLAGENALGSALEMGKRVGWAIGIEMGDAFAKGFESNVKAGGEDLETRLLEAGRAVGVGWCKGCHDVVQLQFGRSGITGSPQLRCPVDNKKADEPLLVVPADATEVQQALRSERR